MKSFKKDFTNPEFINRIAANHKIARDAAVYSALEGVSVFENAETRKFSRVAPLAILPTQFSRRLFERGIALSLLCTHLVDTMSCDSAFIERTLNELVFN